MPVECTERCTAVLRRGHGKSAPQKRQALRFTTTTTVGTRE